VSDVQAEIAQGELLNTEKEERTNPDGSKTTITTYTIKEGNITKKVREEKTEELKK
jgi:uncharacterized protein (UPF0333 family)